MTAIDIRLALEAWADNGNLDRDHIPEIAREISALSTLPIAVEGKDTAISDELTAALDGAFVTTTSGGGQRPYLTVMFPENSQVRRLYDALAAFSSLRRTPSSPGKDGGQEVEAVAYLTRRDDEERVILAKFVTEEDRLYGSNGWTFEPLYTRPQPASTALVERLGLAWAAVGHHEGIEISVHADAADTWNALCAILDQLALSALSASQSTKGDADA